jgi:hypothetical protein
MRVAPPEWHQPPPSANGCVFILSRAMLWLSLSWRLTWSAHLCRLHANLAQTWLCTLDRMLWLHPRQHYTIAPLKNSCLVCIQFIDQTRHRPSVYCRLDCPHSWNRLRREIPNRPPQKSRMFDSNPTLFVWLFRTYACTSHLFSTDTRPDFHYVKLPVF